MKLIPLSEAVSPSHANSPMGHHSIFDYNGSMRQSRGNPSFGDVHQELAADLTKFYSYDHMNETGSQNPRAPSNMSMDSQYIMLTDGNKEKEIMTPQTTIHRNFTLS